MFKKLSLFACTLLIALTANAQGVERPKILVGLVVDQMRWDYLYHYSDSYGEHCAALSEPVI